MTIIYCNQKQIDLSTPKIMGILNCTPDSFSDGGDYFDPNHALDRAFEMIEEGADIIDIGAESSQPHSKQISSAEEVARLLPIVKILVAHLDVPISIDTFRTETMQAMIDEGVDIINDINALQMEGAINTIANSDVAVIMMHMHECPEKMHNIHVHHDITQEIIRFFNDRIMHCINKGIGKERIIIDPGFGFGKSYDDQITLLKTLDQLNNLHQPMLIGLSRKRMIGTMTNVSTPKARTIGSLSAALWCVQKGAKILRVHDVKETKEALAVWQALA